VGGTPSRPTPTSTKANYYGGPIPASGLAVARMLAHITYLERMSLDARKFGRATCAITQDAGYDFRERVSVETLPGLPGAQFVERFDANSYLYITKAIDYFDIASDYGSLDNAMARVQCKVLILSYSSDWLYPPYQSQMLVDALRRQKKDVTYCNIQSDYGHDAFLLEVGVMKKLISGFLTHVANPGPPQKVLSPTEVDSEADTGPTPLSRESIYEGHRVDYDMIIRSGGRRAAGCWTSAAATASCWPG
jgi:homoserine O-acetyltransferase